MLFHSHEFLFLFLPAVLALWRALAGRPRVRLAMLTSASWLFYGLWDVRFLPLLAFSTGLDYIAARHIDGCRAGGGRRVWLLVSIIGNLGTLAVFKYGAFACESAAGLARTFGIELAPAIPAIVLPVGISFYTFQSLSYSVDVYRGTLRPAGSFVEFAAYVSLFPQLVAGPIVRAGELLPQLTRGPRQPSATDAWLGAQRLVTGLAKKLLVADAFGRIADPLFDGSGPLACSAAWLATLAYALQIYFDFSGYSDMAVGLGRLLGLRLPENFDSPYRAASPSDFWRRWHRTLSSWLRDYLYIPLGGDRGGAARTLRNLFITMALGGLWHGAGWTFVVWGLYHGALLVVQRVARSVLPVSLPVALTQPLTLFAVVVGWIPFRAADLDRAGEILRALVTPGLVAPSQLTEAGMPGVDLLAFGLVAAGFLACITLPNSAHVTLPPRRRVAFALGLVAVACVLHLQLPSPFLYFQF